MCSVVGGLVGHYFHKEKMEDKRNEGLIDDKKAQVEADKLEVEKKKQSAYTPATLAQPGSQELKQMYPSMNK
jgi:hypothetical protein